MEICWSAYMYQSPWNLTLTLTSLKSHNKYHKSGILEHRMLCMFVNATISDPTMTYKSDLVVS